ncbi:hypothetical protein AB0D68_10805 [Streptomyces sp. NPDC048212]|uniref:hypothetical protein n=1 Tax=Streptomyces sp. NPDC048212 TaxID=3156658 RepID=UPI00340C3B83
MLAWILSLILPFLMVGGEPATPAAVTIPAVTQNTSEEDEWTEFYTMAYQDYTDSFTALFNGYETKWAKNGRLMLRNGDSGPYKFIKRTV